VVNVPADTALYARCGPGMTQGQRLSRLSKIHGQIYGINIDDFGGLDTAAVHGHPRRAQGQVVDSYGVVHHNTPRRRRISALRGDLSGHTLPAQFVPFVDGIKPLDLPTRTRTTRTSGHLRDAVPALPYPGKEINCGVYIRMETYGWDDPAAIDYSYRHLLDHYAMR